MNASALFSGRARRLRARRHVRWVMVAAAFGATSPAWGVDSSLWDTTTGVWSNANNWLSTINGVTNQHVVPGTGFEVALTPDADVTQDVDASVLDVLGYATTSLTVNAGKSLTANGQTGIIVGYFYTGSIASGGSTVTATAISAQEKLDVYNSTLTAGAISSSSIAFVESSSLSTLSATGYVHINKSSINNNAVLPSYSNLSINATFEFSDVTSSFFNGSVLIDAGASLVVDQGSVITTPSSSASYSILINQGALTLQNGSTLNVNLAAPQMGAGPGACSFTMDGAGTTLNLNSVDFTIAGVSNSTFTMQNGAVYHGNGTSRLVVGPFSALGLFNGISQVNITSGSTMSLTDLLVSGNTGNTPTSIVTLSDPGSSIMASGVIRVTGGAVDIKNQATASGTQIVDVQYGQLTVEGGGTLTSPGPLLVGFNGNASLTIKSGGVLSSNQGVISHKAGSTGVATVSGQGSELQTFSDLTVGMLGAGTLTVAAGGVVSSGAGIVGDQAGSSGKATVGGTGSAWRVGGQLIIGNQQESTGELTIESQGLVETKNAAAIIGNASNTLGTVTVQSGGKWTIDQNLTVGKQGTGQLTIGGIGTEVDSLGATIAALAGSNGAVSVPIGGVWKNTNSVVVADEGSGQLSIDLGARASAGGAVNVANAGGSIGSLTVDGLFNIGGDLSVGRAGAGTMTIENGGAVAGAGGHIGQAPGAVGNVTVTGASAQTHSSWSVTGTLAVGEGGTGTLTIQQGGIVSTGPVAVGAQAGAVGSIDLSDDGSQLNSTGTISIGGGGTGRVTVTAGASITAPTVMVGPGGKLGGDGGSIVATVVNSGGIVRPGDAPGILHVTGDYVQNAGTLMFEIDGVQAGQFDQLVISGQATLSGGSLELDFQNNFIPAAGEQFLLIQANGLSGSGVPIVVTGLPPSLGYNPTYTASGLTVSIVSIPEAGTSLLVLGGIAARLGMRRRR